MVYNDIRRIVLETINLYVGIYENIQSIHQYVSYVYI